MADPTPAEIRAVLREHGEDVPPRGSLGARHIARYEELTGAAPADDGEEYDAGVSAADFPPGDDPGPAPAADPGPAPAPERRPRRVKARQSGGLLASLKNPGKTGSGRPRPKKYPRVPVDRFAGRAWRMFARMAMPVSPPIANCLILQSATAGIILEDVVKDTAGDRMLQPLIRAEAKGEKVFALVAPPVLVGAITAAQGLPDQERAMREAILLPMLREALVLNVEIAGDRLTAELDRVAESADTSAKVDQMLAQIFGPMAAGPGDGDEAPAGPGGDPAAVVPGVVVGSLWATPRYGPRSLAWLPRSAG